MIFSFMQMLNEMINVSSSNNLTYYKTPKGLVQSILFFFCFVLFV